MAISFEPLLEQHWTQVAEIFQQGMQTGIASLETSVPSWHQWDNAHMSICREVAIENEEVLGWVALSPVSGRCVYSGVAEVSIYMANKAQGQGLGQQLLTRCVEQSEQHGIWTLQSGIFAQNKISIALHEKCGFRIVGIHEKLGKLNGKWHDIAVMERRSDKVF